jgi:protein phosphatase
MPSGAKECGVPISAAARTDAGLRRPSNQDAYYAGRSIWAVADGMGGHAAGEIASSLVVEALAEADSLEVLKPSAVVAALQRANRRILDYGRDHYESRGLGSTVAGLARVMVGNAEHWAIFNVGDSRVYRCLNQVMTRATIDHSEIEELINQGEITRDEARQHQRRNVITRSMGSDPAPQVDQWVLPPTPGERFVICTDGLTGELTDEQIAQVALADQDPAAVVEQLLSLALLSGGRDNISIIVVDLPRMSCTVVEESTLPKLKIRSENGSAQPSTGVSTRRAYSG